MCADINRQPTAIQVLVRLLTSGLYQSVVAVIMSQTTIIDAIILLSTQTSPLLLFIIYLLFIRYSSVRAATSPKPILTRLRHDTTKQYSSFPQFTFPRYIPPPLVFPSPIPTAFFLTLFPFCVTDYCTSTQTSENHFLDSQRITCANKFIIMVSLQRRC